MIKERKVESVKVHLYCDKCGTEMEHTGSVYLTYPPRYPHVCPKCGHQETCNKKYPCIEYVEVKEDQP